MTTKITENLFATPASVQLVTSFNVSNTTTFDLLNVFDTSANIYMLVIEYMQVNVDNAGAIRLYLGNAPSTWTTTGWNRLVENWNTLGGYSAVIQNNTGEFNLGSNFRSPGAGVSSVTWIYNPAQTTRTSLLNRQVGQAGSSANAQQVHESFMRNDNTSFNSMRIYSVSSTITNIKGSLYKYKV